MKTDKRIFRMILIIAMSQVPVTGIKAQQLAEVAVPIKLPSVLFEPSFYIWLMLGSIITAVMLTLLKVVRVLSDQLAIKIDVSTTSEAQQVSRVGLNRWQRFLKSMTRSVPIELERDVMLDHDYDGIRELDNELPPWWKYGFGLTVLFAVFYLFNFHVSGTGKLQLQEYQDQLAEAEIQKAELLKNVAYNVNASNVIALTDQISLAEGQSVFQKNCVACHKADGGGNVGPNLTDDYWIHGGGIKNIFNTITQGVPAKGMISWKTQLPPRQIQEVASFILTLHGTNPLDAKEAQGDMWKDDAVVDTSSLSPRDAAKMIKS